VNRSGEVVTCVRETGQVAKDAVGSNELGKKICDLLGLKNVKSLIVIFRVDSCVMLEAEIFVERGEVEEMFTELKKFKLVPLEDGEE
jgi:Holliday junction resolvase